MATVVNFHGKNYIEPGAYAVTVYNPTSTVNVSEFGNVMIIDTGLARSLYETDSDGNYKYEFAGGSGINGELKQGLKSVYEFDCYEDFLDFMGGGMVADIAKVLFTPKDGVYGTPKLYYCRAATTTAAKLTIGGLTFTCKNEGIAGNGVIDDGVLKVGYAAQITAGEDDESKFILTIYRGNYAGMDDAGEAYGSYDYDDASGEMIAESDEVSTIEELYEWASENKYVLASFEVDYSSDTSDTTASLEVTDLTAASGGTTAWLSDTEYADALEAIAELDITFFLATNLTVEDGIDSATTGKLFTFLKNDAKYTEFLAIPGGSGEDDLLGDDDTSQALAKYYDSGQVIVTHGAPIVDRNDGYGTKQLPAIYLTAAIIGLNAGQAAQTPLTYQRVGYQSFVYDLKKKEREKALQAGIMHIRNISGYYCINQGVTTLQDNKQSIAQDGQSMELSIELIKAQLNKELIIEAENRFIGKTTASASPQTVKNFVETKLTSLTASTDNDNLIVSWQNVKVKQNNSDYYVTYDFAPNLPVNKIFFTGNILDISTEV